MIKTETVVKALKLNVNKLEKEKVKKQKQIDKLQGIINEANFKIDKLKEEIDYLDHGISLWNSSLAPLMVDPSNCVEVPVEKVQNPTEDIQDITTEEKAEENSEAFFTFEN